LPATGQSSTYSPGSSGLITFAVADRPGLAPVVWITSVAEPFLAYSRSPATARRPIKVEVARAGARATSLAGGPRGDLRPLPTLPVLSGST
jgi:hypothetical protein